MDLPVLGVLKSVAGFLATPPQGPAVTIAPASIRDVARQDIHPGRITFENSGTASAFSIECEARRYYDPLIPPTYDRKRVALTPALKAGDHFIFELLDTPDVADFCDFEVFVRYRNAAKQSLLSYVRVGMVGEIRYRDHAVSRLRGVVLPAEIWLRHLLASLWVHTKVRVRPGLHRLLPRTGAADRAEAVDSAQHT